MGLVPHTLPSERVLLFDPWTDQQLRSTFRLSSCLELTGLSGALALLKAGAAFAASPLMASKLGSVLQPAAVVAAGRADALWQTQAGSTSEQQLEVAVTEGVTLRRDSESSADAEVIITAVPVPKVGLEL
jgi:hypothetical protein